MNPFSSRSRRSGYTLIELLVALAIILGVMSLVVAIYPNYSQREDLYRSTDILRNAIMRARQWALRDKAITGIQIETSPGNFGATIKMVQSPPKIYGTVTSLKIELATNGVNLKKFVGNTWTAPTPFDPDLNQGDYLYLSGHGGFFISAVPTKGLNEWFLPIYNFSDLPNPLPRSFEIIRNPSPLKGEPIITLSPTVFIDLSGATTNGMILFNDKGQSMPQNVGFLKIRIAQTDSGSPLPSNHTMDLTTADNVIGNYAINETTIKIDASTGISKVLGK